MPACSKAKKCLAPSIGSLDKRIVIEQKTEADDGYGGFTDSWTTVATVWASLSPLKGSERYQAMQLQSPVTHKVVMRYRSGVTNKMRLKYGTRLFNISEAINVDEDNIVLNILAVENLP